MPLVPDARGAIERLSIKGGVLESLELFAVATLLASSRALSGEVDVGSDRHPSLASLRELLYEDQATEKTLARTVDEEGQILDTASKDLKRIRSELRRAHTRIVQKLEGYARSLPERIAVADASVTVRDGRYVIPVRREGRGEVGGIIHDESATGGTVFVEPPVAIALMNDLRDLERDEQREIRRILGQLTEHLAIYACALRGAQSALVDFDSLHARARMAIEWKGEAPEVLEPGSDAMVIEGGRHPLLLAQGTDVVPFDLVLDPGERALVVSGPNTGGKSVLLKALGLIATLTQSRRGAAPSQGQPPALVSRRLRGHRGRAVDRRKPFDVLRAFGEPEGNLRGRRSGEPRADRRNGRRHRSGRGRRVGTLDPRGARGAGRPLRGHLPPGPHSRPLTAKGAES